MKLWLVILGMSAGTYLLRASFLLLPDRAQLPAPVRHALHFVPAAILTAIWAPELLLQKGVLALSLGNERLLAGAAAIAVAWRLRYSVVTILAGLFFLHLFDWLF